MTDTTKSDHLLTRLYEKKALIVEDESGGCATYAAYPGGDRRCRPISWISKDVFTRWLADGVVLPRGKGFEVSAAAVRRRGPGRHGGAQRTHCVETISGDDGIFRPAHVNLNTRSALRVLGNRLDSHGEPFLTPAQLEAGERFAADYARANYGRSQTQDYMRTGGDIARTNTEESAAVAAIDSRDRITEAIAYVGPGLSRAVISICGQDMGLEQMEKNEGWTRRSGRTVLKLALQRLVEFYGTAPGIPPKARGAYAAKVRASL